MESQEVYMKFSLLLLLLLLFSSLSPTKPQMTEGKERAYILTTKLQQAEP